MSYIKSRFAILGVLAVAIGSAGSARAQQAGAPAASATAPIATADGTIPGVHAEIQQLKRDSGGAVTLKYAIINDSDKPVGESCEFSAPEECQHDSTPSPSVNRGYISGVYLIDAANKKKYMVLRDSEKRCVCATTTGIAAHSRSNLWAKFPAPPQNVQAVSVAIPNFASMDDVPIK